MRVLIAPDSFKGSLSAVEVANVTASVVQKMLPTAQITTLPFSDGGEGALDFLQHSFEGELCWVATENAIRSPIKAPYYRMENKVWVELSQAAGLAQLSKKEQNPSITSTYGVGLLLKHALDRHITNLYLGIGGSATHDLGMGIFCALGGKALDKEGKVFLPTGATLNKINKLDTTQLHPNLQDCSFQVVCDVSNPLVGVHGAARVFAPQKGANSQMVEQLEKNSSHLGQILELHSNKQLLHEPKTGAAGGTAAGMKALCNATLSSGFDTFYQWAQLEDLIDQTDLLITGEGSLDSQSKHGKVPLSLAQKAQQKGTPCLAVCGQIKLDQAALLKGGISLSTSLLEASQSLRDAQTNAAFWLEKATETLIKNYITRNE